MIDARAIRIQGRLGPAIGIELVERLVAAGFDTPRKIKAAKDADLKAIKGIGAATVAALRVQLPAVD